MQTTMIRDLKDCNHFRQTIQSRPPRFVHGVVLVLAGLLTAATLWAAVTKVNLVVRAAGRVRPVTTPQKVFVSRAESLGGKVTEVHFAQGQDVRAGDLLLRLDTEKLRAEIARKRRTIAGSEEEVEKSTRLAELEEVQAKASLAKLDAEITQALEEVKNNKDRQDAERRLVEGELHDANVELDSQQRLVRVNAIAHSEVQKAEAKQRELQLKLEKTKIPIEEGKVAILRKARKLAEEDSSVHQQEAKIKRGQKVAEIEAARIEVASLELDLQHAELRAPLTGVVTSPDLKVGDIVEPGRAAVEIAEQGDFCIEMFVSSEEMANVKLGMPVKIKLEAFDFQKYGTLDGKLDFISPDSAVIEGRPGAVYLVRVRVNGDTVGRGELVGKVKLGMACQAEIVTGEESVLELLLKKIRQSISLK